jgi:hypothetical protein
MSSIAVTATVKATNAKTNTYKSKIEKPKVEAVNPKVEKLKEETVKSKVEKPKVEAVNPKVEKPKDDNVKSKVEKPKVYQTKLPIELQYARYVIGVKGARVKGIQTEVGQQTNIEYDFENEIFNVVSRCQVALKAACVKILEYKKEAKTNNDYIKESISIHPDIVKADLAYQMIGSKGKVISEIIKKVGKGSKVFLDEDKYVIECHTQDSIDKLTDLLRKKERDILNSPENKDILAKIRGYVLKPGQKGKVYIELVSANWSLIEVLKKKESIRYQLSKKYEIHMDEVDENDVEKEFNNKYNREEKPKPEVKKTVDDDKFETFIKSPERKLSTVWENKTILQEIVNELPETTVLLNKISIKNHLKMMIEQRKKEIEEEMENEYINISVDDLMSEENEDDDLEVEDIPYEEFEDEEEEEDIFGDNPYDHPNMEFRDSPYTIPANYDYDTDMDNEEVKIVDAW